MKNNYQKLCALSKKIRLLEATSQLLEWDQETYMPKEGAAIRAEQIELIASLSHKEKTSRQFASTLAKFIDLDSGKILATNLSGLQKGALKAWRRDYLLAKALPNHFVKKFAKLASLSQQIWAKARAENRFNDFAPYLKQIVDMEQQRAEYLGYKGHPYNALLDQYEPEMTVQEIDPLFQKIEKDIRHLLGKILQGKKVDSSFLHGSFPAQKQLAFGRTILTAMGYDFEKGRLDLSTHPFAASLSPSDSRITTRIHTSFMFDSISSILHEGGHGLYDTGLPVEHYGTPLSETISLGIHESQSRFWETRIGQSKPFWKHFFPELKKIFKPKFDKVSLAQFYRGVNGVTPSFIRVESDEVTYSLHIIIRYKIEKELIEGTCQVEEIPEKWNALMHAYLGITPSNDREGCLQDIHWSMGGFGYFPTYTLGNIYASQFFETFAQDYPDWEKRVSQGELLFIKEWLNNNIHQYGRAFTASELVKHVTGNKLSATPYLSYLSEKYGEIYDL